MVDETDIVAVSTDRFDFYCDLHADDHCCNQKVLHVKRG